MSVLLTVAVAQPRVVAGDLAAAAVVHADAVRRARARLVVFPELSLTGYELNAADVDPEDPALWPLAQACAEAKCVALVGAPVGNADGGRSIATLIVGDGRTRVAYRKRFLGGEELDAFTPGPDDAGSISVDGWKVVLGICKDTGNREHVGATVALEPGLYVAGVVHHDHELAEQDRRGAALALAIDAPVAFASCAAPTGGGYEAPAGHSTIWDADGEALARSGSTVGAVGRAELHA